MNPATNNVAVQTSPATNRRRERTSFEEFRPFKLWFPWLVPAIVIANIVLFAVSMFINNCPKNSANCSARFLGRFAFQPMKENPLLGPSSSTLEKMGALDVSRVVHKHQVWRLFTCIWLHVGVAHVLANLLSLWHSARARIWIWYAKLLDHELIHLPIEILPFDE